MNDPEELVESTESADGYPVLYRLTRDEPMHECPHCLQDECVQRISMSKAWGDAELVEHIFAGSLS